MNRHPSTVNSYNRKLTLPPEVISNSLSTVVWIVRAILERYTRRYLPGYWEPKFPGGPLSGGRKFFSCGCSSTTKMAPIWHQTYLLMVEIPGAGIRTSAVLLCSIFTFYRHPRQRQHLQLVAAHNVFFLRINLLNVQGWQFAGVMNKALDTVNGCGNSG